MQIGGEGVEILLMNMVLEKKTLKKKNWKRHPSMPFYLGMG